MASDHSNSERVNPLPPHRLLFYMHHPTDRITHTTAFVTPVVEHWLEREIAQWVTVRDRSEDLSHHLAPIYLMMYSVYSHQQLYRHLKTIILGSHLGTGFKSERVFKGPMGRCKATTPSSLSLTSNRVTTNY